MYLELTVADFFASFESPRRISQFLAEGFANNNCFLVGAAAEELINRSEDAIIATVVRGISTGGRFNVNTPVVCIFSEILSGAGSDHPILQAINRGMFETSKDDGLWVERAVASAVAPNQLFSTDQELVKWFQNWLKDDKYFKSYCAPTPDNGPVIPEEVDD